jgi:hypothetical protein
VEEAEDKTGARITAWKKRPPIQTIVAAMWSQ